MEIKIDENLSKQCREDMEISAALEAEAQKLYAEAVAKREQAKGIHVLVQQRVYKSLEMDPVEGDMMDFTNHVVLRKDGATEPKNP